METPEFFIGDYLGVSGDKHYSPENFCFDQKPADNNHFTVDDLLNFSKDDEVMNDAFFHNITANSTDSLTVTAVGSCNSSVSGYETPFSGDFSCRSFTDTQFSGELCIPYDDLAELEWLSNFVEDSISSDQFQNFQPISTTNISPTDSSSSEMGPKFWPEPTTTTTHPIFPSDISVRGKARSKRSRVAPCDWSSRLLHLSPATTAEAPTRRCQHCGSEKTPQWRAGPMGPKTLCNACGVRFKSGRLVPEYRPAASPTFVSTQHSNSHRKVLELRRQKEEIQRQQFICQSSVFGVSNGHDDYLVPHHRRMI